MAVNFSLTDKTTKSVVKLLDVDKEICALFDIPVHDKDWGGEHGVRNWYDTIGFQLASGKTYDEIRLHYVKSDLWIDELPWLLKCINYLEQRYVPNSWHSY